MDGQPDRLAREHVVALPELRAHVVEAGAGTPILLLHGFPQSSREWSRAIPLLALLNALEIERAVVVGHDIGALVAMSLAIEHPERVTHVGVLSVPPMYLRPRPSMVQSMPGLWFQYALATPGLGARLLRGGRQRLPRWLLAGYGGVAAADAEVYVASMRDPARARAGSRIYRQLVVPEFLRIVRGAFRDRLPAMPILVLLGGDDHVLPRDVLEGIDRYAPDVRIEEVPGAGHWIVDDRPEEVARRILAFAGLTTPIS